MPRSQFPHHTIAYVQARDDVYAHFKLEQVVVDELRAAASGGQNVLRWFETEVQTPAGEVIAIVRKQVCVRLKPTQR